MRDKLKNTNFLFSNPKATYTLLGVLFGFLFPFFVIIYMLIYYDLPFSVESILYLHRIMPILFVIDTAPFFLGLFAYFVGVSKHKVMLLYQEQNKILTTDSLTGLKNRYACEKKIEELKNSSFEKDKKLGIIIINIGNLKKINNLMGISFGNQTVIMLAKFLRSNCPEGMELFRINGNEFCIISLNGPVTAIASLTASTFCKPVKIQNLYCLIELHIGVASTQNYCTQCESVLDQAYNAMNYHKKRPTEPYEVYSDALQPPTSHVAIESKLFSALSDNEFYLVYQPVVDAATMEIKGAEALLRWHSPDFGVVSPVVFIPLLESSHLIIDVGLWVIKEACRQTKAWQKQFNNEHMFISINVSVSQLFDEKFIPKLIDIINEIDIDKNTIRLEITESISDERREFVRDKIILLGEYGFRLSIDDFGTGYSSLAELDSMPLYSLKVDKSFVDRIGHTAKQSHVIELIVRMSHNMNLRVVMEGVETEAQYQYLQSIGCDFIQGFYFSKPLYQQEFEKLMLCGFPLKNAAAQPQ